MNNVFSVWKINCVQCVNVFVGINFKTMNNKTMITFSFCDIWNNQGLGIKSVLPQEITLISNCGCKDKNLIQ